jgi:hypothetical protein
VKIFSTLTAALLVVLSTTTAARAAVDPDESLIRQLIPSVFRVEAANADGSVSIGSGVVIARGLVATNCHVTRHASSINLVRAGVSRPVESQFSNVEHDLCLLYSPAMQDEPVVALAPWRPQTGQTVYAVGFAGGVRVRVSSGQIAALYDYDGGKIIQTDAWFTFGASGGGLFDEEGRLIGIISFMSRDPKARHYCLPASWVSWAAEHFDGQPVTPLNGLPFWQKPPEHQPYFLRAASLEAAKDWSGLANLAREWTFAESDNPSSWFSLGTAYAHLNDRHQTIAAYSSAVAMDADLAGAWYGLGIAYAEDCQPAELAYVRAMLAGLDGHLAEDLARRYGNCERPADGNPSGRTNNTRPTRAPTRTG